MARSIGSKHNSTHAARGRITKTKTVGRASIRKRSSTSARNRTQSSARGRSNNSNQKRSTSDSKSRSRSSSRNVHGVNNSAIRHGRSMNASRGISRTKKSVSSVGARKKKTKNITGRLNNKKKGSIGGKNNNQRQRLKRDQQSKKKKKKTTSVSSLIPATISSLTRSDDDFHRESTFGTNE